jgi:hypothetical protein
MSAHIIIRDGKALAAVRTEPFDISLTDAGSEVSLLADYEDAKKITQVEAKAPEDGALALEEKWVNATDDTVLTLLGRIADINGWNIVPRNDLPNGAFEDATLANRYQEGDVVDTPDSGVGVIAGAVSEDQTAPDDSDLPDIEASPDSPTYVVVTEDESQGMSLLKASDLEATEIEAEVDALDTTKEAAAMAELAPDDSDSEIAELDFTMPESWRESDTPARVIALDAFASMGGSFDGCVRTMRDAVSNPDALCGSFLDEVLGYEAWRGDSPLPGD